MNTKRVFLGLFAFALIAMSAVSCADNTADEAMLYENSIDKDKHRIKVPPNGHSIDKDKHRIKVPPNGVSIDKDKHRIKVPPNG